LVIGYCLFIWSLEFGHWSLSSLQEINLVRNGGCACPEPLPYKEGIPGNGLFWTAVMFFPSPITYYPSPITYYLSSKHIVPQLCYQTNDDGEEEDPYETVALVVGEAGAYDRPEDVGEAHEYGLGVDYVPGVGEVENGGDVRGEVHYL
jgi:hypothetical protein